MPPNITGRGYSIILGPKTLKNNPGRLGTYSVNITGGSALTK